MKMNAELYRQRKLENELTTDTRAFCFRCRHPKITCYCASVKPIVSSPRFVILMHPHEVKKTIGTGRMTHHCLKNSTLWVGSDFDNSKQVNDLIHDQSLSPVLLFPGPQSQNLSLLSDEQRAKIFAPGKDPVVIVLDATWIYAKKMLYRSPNLQRLPRICFDPPHLSKFLLRKQPSVECFSTIEATHEIINLIACRREITTPAPQDHLIQVFEEMVDRQLAYRRSVRHSRHRINYFRRKGMSVPVDTLSDSLT